MAATKIGVLYSLAQSRVRCIIVPDDDKQLDAWRTLNGEGFLTYDLKLGSSEAEAQAQVTALTGRDAEDDKYVVLDETGKIVERLKGDPAIDTITKEGTVVKESDIPVDPPVV